MDDIKAKQQIVEKIKSSTNILVTVSNDPSVDALSAALGLSLLLDKLEKHPTAVFSGATPPAIAFLEPEKTFDETTDSLRDFIIALDKEKADHLRYKVEGDSVKIFITPYKTTITSDDLQFSQGDFNVELVIALGVDNQDHLDGALESHGQILHDATIITVTAGEQTSDLGGIDWHDDQASSLSEMVAGLAEALKSDKTKSLLDGQIATAFLTGIVAETDRFSNTHTTSKVMTVAAQLMGAGADQQLIAAKLQESHEIGNLNVSKDEPEDEPEKEVPVEAPVHKDTLSINHDAPHETLEEMDKRVKAEEQAEAAVAANEALDAHNAFKEAQDKSEADDKDGITANANAAGAYAFDDDSKTDELKSDGPADEQKVEVSKSAEKSIEPSLGGTLNATTEQAADDARREVENDQNKMILSHAYMQSTDNAAPAPVTAPDTTPTADTSTPVDVTSTGASSYVLGHDEPTTPATSAYAFPSSEQPSVAPTHELVLQPLPPQVPSTPADLGLPMPPAVPDFSAPPLVAPMAPAYALPTDPLVQAQQPQPQPERLGDILAPEVPTTSAYAPAPQPVQPPAPTAPVSNDPGQFKIPGQQ